MALPPARVAAVPWVGRTGASVPGPWHSSAAAQGWVGGGWGKPPLVRAS